MIWSASSSSHLIRMIFQFICRHVWRLRCHEGSTHTTKKKQSKIKYIQHKSSIICPHRRFGQYTLVSKVSGLQTAVTLLEKYDTLWQYHKACWWTSLEATSHIDGKIKKHSQFQNKTDVPFDIDAMNFRREASEVIYTPALIDFSQNMNFISPPIWYSPFCSRIYLETPPIKASWKRETLLEKIQRIFPTLSHWRDIRWWHILL